MRRTTPVSIRSWARPVDPGGSGPSRSRYPPGASSLAFLASGSSSGRAPSRLAGSSVAGAAVFLGIRREAGKALFMLLDGAPALRAPGQPVEPGDLPVALHTGWMLGRQAADQVLDPVAELQREVRGGGAHELAHVLHGGLALEAVGLLVLAHGRKRTAVLRYEDERQGCAVRPGRGGAAVVRGHAGDDQGSRRGCGRALRATGIPLAAPRLPAPSHPPAGRDLHAPRRSHDRSGRG